MDVSIITLEPISVMYVLGERGKSIPEQSHESFKLLESKLKSLKGRKFYGAEHNGVYRACVAINSELDEQPLPHPHWIIPGGRYARVKIRDWERNAQQIPEVFSELCQRKDYDADRSLIEYYRSQRELVLMAPIK